MMSQVLHDRRLRFPRGRLFLRCVPLLIAAGLTDSGCAEPDAETPLPNVSSSGLQLPPDFQIVDVPIEKRQEIFREAHLVRARAVQEANRRLPMDEAHLPIGDTPAFDKRVAEHKAIIDELLAKDLAALAQRYEISTDELSRIEDEASRLHWIPPRDPTPDPAPKSEEPAKSG